MAKRRRKKPNIPQAAMEHAIQNANEDDVSDSADEEAVEETPKAVAKESKAEAKPRRRRRRDVQSAKLNKRKNEGKLDGAYVADMLANPTKVVTEDELKSDYAYVIKDLRNMGILAAVLMVALIVISVVVL
jgi:hypothetical protein